MLTDKELINQVRKLSQIKPEKDWVFLTKKQILGEAKHNFGFFPFLKPALASFAVILVLMAVLGFAKSALPGEPLYAIRKAAHWGRTLLASGEEKPAVH